MKMIKVLPELLEILNRSITAVLPENLILTSVVYNHELEKLTILKNTFNLKNKTVYVVGAGKAVRGMAVAFETLLGPKIKQGLISVPVGSLNNRHIGQLTYCEGAKYNLPDKLAESTAKEVYKLITNLGKNDILFVLLSGGGSASLPLPKYPITLEEKVTLIRTLANAGADITEVNCVRKRISDLKGGQLAIRAQPAKVVSLILSDIVSDPLDLIASGPTVENEDDPSAAIDILKKYELYDNLPESIKIVLSDTTQLEFPKGRVWNHIIGSNKICVKAAQKTGTSLNYLTRILSNTVTGNVSDVAQSYANLARLVCALIQHKMELNEVKSQIGSLRIPGINLDFLDDIQKNRTGSGTCLILGGEITVQVKGSGIGGRNQHLALEFSKYIHEMKSEIGDLEVYFLSAGTDGIDGPTDAAGAVGYVDLVSEAQAQGLNVDRYLHSNDSYTFFSIFRSGLFHVRTGHSNTNVMDLHVMIIKKPELIVEVSVKDAKNNQYNVH